MSDAVIADNKQVLVANENFVGRLVYWYLFPSIGALLGYSISSLITGILMGNMLGGLGLSVIALVYPVSLVYMSIGSLIGVGASIISGIALGKDDKDLCAQMFTLSFIFALAVAVVLTIGGLLNLDRIVGFLGAGPEQFSLARDYVRIYFIGGSGMLLLYIPLNYLRITGKPNRAMVMLLLMGLMNIAGLSIFVVLLGLGLKGAALSSVISIALTFFFGLFQLRTRDSPLKLKMPKKVRSHFVSLVTSGSSSALSNISQAVQILSLNLLLVRMGSNAFLPSFSLVITASDFLLAFILGASQSVLPLVSISMGERDFRSINIILKRTMIIGNLIVGLCGVLLIIFHNQIPLVFGLKDEVLRLTAGRGIVFLALSLNLSFMNYMLINYFSATRRASVANIIVVCKLVLFMVLSSILLFGAMGITAVWISLIITEAATLGMVFILIFAKYKKNPTLSRWLLLNTSLVDGINTIDFSVKNTMEDVTFASGKIADFCEENELPQKKITQISLAIEEMLLMLNDFSFDPQKEGYADIRLVISRDGGIVMRIRNFGKNFNPIDYYYNNKDTEEGFEHTLGIAIIVKTARDVRYRTNFGVNNLIITI
jgi:Na+-driven multidrug efflux pump/anti-sigma regulatory factor (Ser/Thr protein kinase)